MYAEEVKESTRYFHTRKPKGKLKSVLTFNWWCENFLPKCPLLHVFLFFGVNFSDTSDVPVHLELFRGKTNFKQNSQFGDSIHVQIEWWCATNSGHTCDSWNEGSSLCTSLKRQKLYSLHGNSFQPEGKETNLPSGAWGKYRWPPPKQRQQGQAEKTRASRLHRDLAQSAPMFCSLGKQWGEGVLSKKTAGAQDSWEWVSQIRKGLSLSRWTAPLPWEPSHVSISIFQRERSESVSRSVMSDSLQSHGL